MRFNKVQTPNMLNATAIQFLLIMPFLFLHIDTYIYAYVQNMVLTTLIFFPRARKAVSGDQIYLIKPRSIMIAASIRDL